MPKLYSLARMSTATTGTGTITLGSAVTGFLTFTQAGVADGDVVTYAIADGINSEIGRGTYTASGTTLTRSVLRSTNGNAAVSLSGTAQVFITAAAEDLRFKLTSATAFFVDSVNGNDNNDGLAAGTGRALATIQGAINLLQSKYDLNGQNLTIKTTTSGSYAPFVVKSDFVGAGTVTIVGSPNLAITAATNANPSVITAPGHDYANGDHYIGSGALGNTAINGAFKVANANIGAGTFTLVNENSGAAIAGNGAYTGGGPGRASRRSPTRPQSPLSASSFRPAMRNWSWRGRGARSTSEKTNMTRPAREYSSFGRRRTAELSRSTIIRSAVPVAIRLATSCRRPMAATSGRKARRARSSPT